MNLWHMFTKDVTCANGMYVCVFVLCIIVYIHPMQCVITVDLDII